MDSTRKNNRGIIKASPNKSIAGFIGGFAGGFLFDLLNITWGGTIGQLGTAVVGAVVVLWIASKLKK